MRVQEFAIKIPKNKPLRQQYVDQRASTIPVKTVFITQLATYNRYILWNLVVAQLAVAYCVLKIPPTDYILDQLNLSSTLAPDLPQRSFKIILQYKPRLRPQKESPWT